MTDRKAPPRAGGNSDDESKQLRDRQDEARRARFARAIARSEFGRHYWDDGLQAQLRDALHHKKKK